MDIIQNTKQQEIILKSFENSMSYAAYRALVIRMVKDNSTTGSEKTEALINYTLLNERRMRRWEKTVKISEADKAFIENYSKKIIWLVITESWCGDAAHIMPLINKVAELNANIDYKVVLRDENEALMSEFLTNGNRSIPKLIMLDAATNEVLNTFGPRPTVATKMVYNYKTLHGQLSPEFKEDLQRWYNKDKGKSIIADLLKLLQ
ncbi:thioredoxin family protein [Winogradskyella ursingii]|uniref:thioredoxin family protein n=1 Tax=Winogradskyella ursingii TaxID=2686079 RepID=UPI0015C89D84|nr:thioredoxin family protein [Winogradskyella ursingii]